jgi:hypothetical protein
MRVLTLDIGGANTKRMVVEFAGGKTEILEDDLIYFPIWREWRDLGRMLEGVKEEVDAVAVTMTAEEADCFTSKDEGVRYIVKACDRTFGEPLYLTIRGELVRSKDIEDPLDLSAANWVASADYLEEKYGEGTLVDMGSTTTDIIPFRADMPFVAKSDLERLKAGWLVYTGFLRTPVAGIVKKVPVGGEAVPISPEFFAQTADVYRILGLLEDYPCETPDRGEKTPEASMKRVARHLCADVEELGEEAIVDICSHIMEQQVRDLAEALARVHRGGKVYCCGMGREVVHRAAEMAGGEAVDLSREIPAFANLPCYGLAHMVREYEGR